jgi:hypothetical protein
MRKWNVLVLPLLLLPLAGCGSDDSPTTPAPVIPASPTPAPAPTPTPSASSRFAGSWVYRTTFTAVDVNCGHTSADIGKTEPPVAVTVLSDGTFALRDGSGGAIDSAGNVSLTLGDAGGSCAAGSGAGGCRDNDHCDGTSVQAGDVSKWTLFRQ